MGSPDRTDCIGRSGILPTEQMAACGVRSRERRLRPGRGAVIAYNVPSKLLLEVEISKLILRILKVDLVFKPVPVL